MQSAMTAPVGITYARQNPPLALPPAIAILSSDVERGAALVKVLADPELPVKTGFEHGRAGAHGNFRRPKLPQLIIIHDAVTN